MSAGGEEREGELERAKWCERERCKRVRIMNKGALWW